MFVARNEAGQLVNVLEDELVKGDYSCPGCRGAVSLKNGSIMRKHFAHRSLDQCQFYAENESAEHLNLKATFYRWAKQDHPVAVEQYLPDIQQIADVFVGDKLALEIQCSPLNPTRLAERTSSYREQGYQVIWLLGKKLWFKDRLTAMQHDFLYFSQMLGFYLWEADLERHILRLQYLIHEDLHGRVQCKVKEFPFGTGDLLAVLRYPFQQKSVQTLLGQADQDICAYVRKQLYFQVPKWMRLQEEAYLSGGNLLEQSVDDFYPQLRLPAKESFTQISQNLDWYRDSFIRYYQNQPCKRVQVLYSPAFYRTILRKNMIE